MAPLTSSLSREGLTISTGLKVRLVEGVNPDFEQLYRCGREADFTALNEAWAGFCVLASWPRRRSDAVEYCRKLQLQALLSAALGLLAISLVTLGVLRSFVEYAEKRIIPSNPSRALDDRALPPEVYWRAAEGCLGKRATLWKERSANPSRADSVALRVDTGGRHGGRGISGPVATPFPEMGWS
jgi:hypothetical protein